MKIILPLPPNMANSRMHWRPKYRIGQEYLEQCGIVAREQAQAGTIKSCGGRSVSGEVLVGYQTPSLTAITATIYHTHTMDQDNAMARLKWPVDWLVGAGWIVDDDPDHLVWTGVPTQVRCKRDERRVEFVLEPA